MHYVMSTQKNRWHKIICLLISTHILSLLAQPRSDANGYRYKNETTVQHQRKIAVLSYGSLVRQKENRQTNARLEASEFSPTDLVLPVSMSRYSQKAGRFTAVIDNNGDPKRVWAATSAFTFLPNARNNLAAREGARYMGQRKGYDLTHTFYMKKLFPGQIADHNEKMITATNWTIRIPKSRLRCSNILSADATQQIAAWADANGYTAVIWASFPSNVASHKEIIRKLLRDDILLKDTQDYIKNLPDGAQSAFEYAVLAGEAQLRALL